MPAKAILKVTQGQLQGQEFVFAERTTCIIGRGKKCYPQLPSDEHHRTVSRHHCLLDINPPDIRIRDFGSRNGTWINGTKIGERAKDQTPEQAAQIMLQEHDLKHGDEIRLGKTVFRIQIHVPVRCAECGAELPDDAKPPSDKAASDKAASAGFCSSCQDGTGSVSPTFLTSRKAKYCAQCGRDVAGEVGESRRGEFICAACKKDPDALVKNLLVLAQTRPDKKLSSIRGYHLLQALGRGGMGAVYLARHEKTGEQVAIKVMLPEIAFDEEAKNMFLRETENCKSLKHPHVVELKDYGCSSGIFYMTLEFCKGGSVDRLMEARGGKLPIGEAGKIILQALRGLEYAHSAEIKNVRQADGSYASGRGLVHRDLKPHNLFLAGPSGNQMSKVADFGLAKAFDLAGLSGLTATGSKMGSPAFMPRQQVEEFKYAKPDVDVWAMAASFYYMVTGHPPRDFPRGSNPWWIVLTNNPVPIRQRNPTIPARLAALIDEALIEEPEFRFKTASEFRQALQAVL